MQNLHKQPVLYLTIAVGLFGIVITFFQQHCSVSPTDLLTLGIGVATYLGGYFHGKNKV